MKTTILIFTVFAISSLQALGQNEVNPGLIYWKEFVDLVTHSKNDQVIPNYKKASIDEEYREVATSYDAMFRRLARANSATLPCDWGSNPNEGPELLLPHLALAKRTAEVARLRSRIHVHDGNASEAIKDTVTVLTLARHVGSEGYLVNWLVEAALSSMMIENLAQHFHAFSHQDLEALKLALTQLPNGGTIGPVVKAERDFMAQWMVREVENMIQTHADNKPALLAALRDRFVSLGMDNWGAILSASNGSPQEVLKLLTEIRPYYDEVGTIFQLPPKEAMAAIQAHEEKMKQHDNPLLKMLLPSWSRALEKVSGSQLHMQMLMAAIEYKLNGITGFEGVRDPYSGMPFKMKHMKIEGKDRGFLLESKSDDLSFYRHGFIESGGKGLILRGTKVGQVLE